MDYPKIRLSRAMLVAGFLLSLIPAFSQQATLTEEKQTIPTYLFGDPDPIPILSKRTDIYPYFRFDGYTREKTDPSWTVVTLENDWVKTMVLPEVGGKVWGIIDKASGEDVIYWNRVLKFRDVGMRGAWTSGGIEFNFGLIGHTPATATPVDYLTRTHEDGSVSCYIGGIDLPARTQWRVEIRVPKDKAYVITRSHWYNPTGLHHPYYYWSNSAVHATDDLEFFYPGTHYIGHGGELSAWPIDAEGRNLALYTNNQFGPSKSYHILGETEHYKGVYWHDKDIGMGHWALHSDLPGQKLWLWALSRQGGIWEDLLTDEQGQYVEVQAGRMFNQAAYNSGFHSPFGQGPFRPYSQDQWEERWFPLKGTAGIHAASPSAALSVQEEAGQLTLKVMALQALEAPVEIFQQGERTFSQSLELSPQETVTIKAPIDPAFPFSIQVAGAQYHSKKGIERPLSHPDINKGPLFEAEQQFLMRDYARARIQYEQALAENPALTLAWTRLAEISFRQARYEEALGFAKKALQLDTYDGPANLLFGTLHRAVGNPGQAMEAFSIATKDPGLRAGAYQQMAEIAMAAGDLTTGQLYLNKSREAQPQLLPTLQSQALFHRKSGKPAEAARSLEELLTLDPLNHFARFEQWKLNPSQVNQAAFQTAIRNELPHETYLELAMTYLCTGHTQEAIEVLSMAPPQPMVYYTLGYLTGEDRYIHQADSMDPALVFPHRRESLPILAHASRVSPFWTPSYYLGLLYWGLGRPKEALAALQRCGQAPKTAAFYLTRALLTQELLPQSQPQITADLERALSLDPEQWRAYRYLGEWRYQQGDYAGAADILQQAHQKFPDNFNVGLTYARYLLRLRKYESCLEVLNDTYVLPFEGASAGHEIYAQAHIFSALDQIDRKRWKQARTHLEAARDWPERLGVGKPYDPDERLLDYLLAYVLEQQKKSTDARAIYQRLAEEDTDKKDAWTYLQAAAAQKLGNTYSIDWDEISGIDKAWLQTQLENPEEAAILANRYWEGHSALMPMNRFSLLTQVLKRIQP